MGKVRTYGVSKEVLEAVSNEIYLNLIERVGSVKPDKNIEEIMEVLLMKPSASKTLIVSSLIYGIGNFDRIDKVEIDAELGKDGLLEKPTEVRPDYIR